MTSPTSSLVNAVLSSEDRLYPQDLPRDAAEASVRPPLPDLTPLPQPPLDEEERALVEKIARRLEAREEFLRSLVEVNSGSRNQEGVSAVLDLLSAPLISLGFEAEDHPAVPEAEGSETLYGPHRILRRRGQEGGARLLLMGHVDTVFEPGCGFETARRDGDRLCGPGAADMKGGLVVMLDALAGLAEIGRLDRRDVTVLLNGDEEISSRGSRPLIERLSREADVGLVFEPGRDAPWGGVTLARKGTGAFAMTVRGRAAHSGNRYIDGTSAVDELARKVIAIQRLTDLPRGRTLNVGIMRTGPSAKRNTVAEVAVAEFDMRVMDPTDADTVVAAVREIAARTLVTNPWTGVSTTTDLEGGLARPPMPCTESRATLYRQLAGIASRLGAPIGAVSVGGGSDANIAAAQGLLVIDGLGPVGGGLHTTQEWVDLPSLGHRASLTALLMKRVWEGSIPVGAR